MSAGLYILMKMEEKYYAVINCIFKPDINPNFLFVKLKIEEVFEGLWN